MKQYLRGFAGLTVVAVLIRVRFAFALVAVLGLLAAVAWWLGGRGRKVVVEREAPERAFIGDTLTVGLIITNPGRHRAAWVTVGEDVPQALMPGGVTPPPRWVLDLAAGERRRFEYPIAARMRGYYRLGPATGETGDAFGMRTVPIEGGPADRLIVYPKVVPINRLQLATRAAVPAVATRQALMEDPARIRGTRGYVPGDSMRTIHWTASAGAGELLVKQLEPSTARTTVVALDLVQRDFGAGSRSSGVELAVTTAASLLVHVIGTEKLAAGLIAHGHDPISDVTGSAEFLPRTERGHLMGMLDYLARVQVAREGSFVDTLRAASARLPWATSIVVVAGGVGESLAATVLQLQQRGLAPTVLLIQSDLRSRDGERLLVGRGVPVRRIERESDLGVLSEPSVAGGGPRAGRR